MEEKNQEWMTEQEFLAQWEKNHARPQEKEKQKEWLKQRQQALGRWLMEQELERNDVDQKNEKERFRSRIKRHINSHILEREFDLNIVKEPCFLTDTIPYTEEMFDSGFITDGLEGLTALAQIANLGGLAELANTMGNAMVNATSPEGCDTIWKGMLESHKKEYVKMRRECQCGKPERMIDQLQLAMRGMVKGALAKDWNYNRLIKFTGERIEQVLYRDREHSPEMDCFLQKFKERDKDNVLREFNALRRMTELSALYQQTVAKLKDKAMEKEFFTGDELRDFLVGSVVSNELRKSYEQKKLTKEALRFGDVQSKTNRSGGCEVIYGDEKIYQEMIKSESYQKLSKMRIGEIRKMLKREMDVEINRQKTPAPVKEKNRAMVLKPQNYD